MFIKNWVLTFKVTPDSESTVIVNEAPKVVDAQHDKLQGGYLVLEPGVPMTVAMSSVSTAEAVLFISDRSVSIRLNNSLTPFQGRYLLLDGADVTKIVLVNNDTNAAHVRLQLLGK